LAFASFPLEHWKKLWSTNPLERLNREVKRRTDVVGVFPNSESLLRLAGSVLIEAHDEWAVSDRRYLSERSMAMINRRVVDEEVVTDEAVVVSFALLGMDVKCLRKGFLLCNAPSRLR